MKGLDPDTGDRLAAELAFSFIQVDFSDGIPLAENKELFTPGAVGSLPLMTWNITDVRIFKARIQGNFHVSLQSRDWSWRKVTKFIKRIKPGEMNGGVCAQFIFDPGTHLLNRLRVVVLGRDDQVSDLQVNSFSFQSFQGPKNWGQTALGHTAIILFAETFEVDVGCRQYLTQFFQGPWVDEPVGMIDVENPFLSGQSGGVQHIFKKDGRLCISIGDGSRTGFFGKCNHLVGGHFEIVGLIRGDLRDLPVLAELTAKITPCCGNGK